MKHGAVVWIVSSNWSMSTESRYKAYKPYVSQVYIIVWKFWDISKIDNIGCLFELFDYRNVDNSSKV